MHKYQHDFVDFLVASGVLTFGDFVTKSGRKTPYFVTTGNFDDGVKIGKLGQFYANHIEQLFPAQVDIVFGPAYKGIPLAVTTSIALSNLTGRSIGYSFNRKEVKDHGDGGTLVGTKLTAGARVVLVEDVITAGTTFREIVPLLRGTAKIQLLGAVLAVDRRERGLTERSAVAEIAAECDLKVCPIVTIHQILEHLDAKKDGAGQIPAAIRERIDAYLEEYGAA